MIKKTSPVFLFSIGIFLSGLPLWADPPSLVGRINFLSGTVSANAGSVGEWSPANLNYPLTTGDGLWVDTGSKAEVQAGSTVLRLGPETDFGFTNLSDGVLQVRLSQGLLNVTVREFDNGDTVEIDSPNSTTLVQSPGSYQVSVGPNGDTLVQVNQGKADVHSGTYDFTVAPHQLATVTSIDKPRYLLENAPGPSEWDLWVQDRDQKALRAPTLRYVSQDTIGYEDLDDNGTWENLPPYGWVWSPNRVAADWAPYHDGHWSWIEPWGWTWIDNATWGFAPFHYGRWASSHSRWYWIPGDRASRQVYAPALVVFLGGRLLGGKSRLVSPRLSRGVRSPVRREPGVSTKPQPGTRHRCPVGHPNHRHQKRLRQHQHHPRGHGRAAQSVCDFQAHGPRFGGSDPRPARPSPHHESVSNQA